MAIVLDVGNNMNQSAPGSESFLETSLNAVRAILQRKVSFYFIQGWPSIQTLVFDIRQVLFFVTYQMLKNGTVSIPMK